ncbi:hypothetical protein BHM03_00009643 [Ensete ventricosum]|nr:hypothetical protein BHM03_00009643 [Ensete ventricosum]
MMLCPGMAHLKTPLGGIINDVKGRASCYKQDWICGCHSGMRYDLIFSIYPSAPSISIAHLVICSSAYWLQQCTSSLPPHFLSSPSENNSVKTPVGTLSHWIDATAPRRLPPSKPSTQPVAEGALSAVETLASTAICGVIHSMIGGQPMLIVGVAEPTVIMYTYLYSFAKGRQDLGGRWLRGFTADYGVPLMVLLWTAMSYAVPDKIPSGVPRRLFSPLPWEPKSLYHWTVAKDMLSVPPVYIFAAIIPAVMVAGLYFFDHSVASQMAQQKEFNLKKPSAYHYDILVLGFMARLPSTLFFFFFFFFYCGRCIVVLS